MTNQEILEKAITKAIAGGWKPEPLQQQLSAAGIAAIYTPMSQMLIFNHDFAKSLWGERETAINQATPLFNPIVLNEGWQWHLQRMVIAPDPIQYLGEHLDD